MKALLSIRPGGPETLTLADVPEPVAGDGQVVMRVMTCGVNYPDVLIIEDRYQERPPRPFAPGGEVAGIVETVGAGVTDLQPGDRVVGLTYHGGMAEKVVIRAALTLKLPPDAPFAESATLLATYSTSYHALKDRGMLKPGERLLVLGASGGVGLAAVELGKTMGARVVAAVSSAAKAAAARAAGADGIVIYPTDLSAETAQRDLTRNIRAAFDGENADVVFDPVGGAYTEAAVRATAWGGRVLIVGFVAGIARLPLNLPLLKGCAVVGVLLGGHAARDPAGYRRNADELLALHRAGRLKPLISARFPLAQGGDAIASLRDRKSVGKVVVTIDD